MKSLDTYTEGGESIQKVSPSLVFAFYYLCEGLLGQDLVPPPDQPCLATEIHEMIITGPKRYLLDSGIGNVLDMLAVTFAFIG